jgi:hypothetical protein
MRRRVFGVDRAKEGGKQGRLDLYFQPTNQFHPVSCRLYLKSEVTVRAALANKCLLTTLFSMTKSIWLEINAHSSSLRPNALAMAAHVNSLRSREEACLCVKCFPAAEIIASLTILSAATVNWLSNRFEPKSGILRISLAHSSIKLRVNEWMAKECSHFNLLTAAGADESCDMAFSQRGLSKGKQQQNKGEKKARRRERIASEIHAKKFCRHPCSRNAPNMRPKFANRFSHPGFNAIF